MWINVNFRPRYDLFFHKRVYFFIHNWEVIGAPLSVAMQNMFCFIQVALSL